MTKKRGTVKLFTFSLEIDAPNIISYAPKIFSCAPKISAVCLKIYIWQHKCSQTQILTLSPVDCKKVVCFLKISKAQRARASLFQPRFRSFVCAYLTPKNTDYQRQQARFISLLTFSLITDPLFSLQRSLSARMKLKTAGSFQKMAGGQAWHEISPASMK